MSVTDKLKARLDKRRRIGIRKYGRELTSETSVNLLEEAIDEALDLAAYLQAYIDAGE
ncbi:hypothetical protein LCGC14_2468950 [marine sediment metagenome]|uniref:Uncharacterized protein n=1 Tax=marine sediment metagenome TaxID=412755 RepID=A0A0F9BBK5_9ZZZZ